MALHDHTYSKPPERESCQFLCICKEKENHASSYVYVRDCCPFNAEQLKLHCKQIKESLFCSDEQRIEIEQKTQQKFLSALWHELRYKRIIASK
jgi:hypothetical protein